MLRGGAGGGRASRGSRSGSCSPSSASPRRARRTCARRSSSPSGEDTARAYLHLGELLRVRGDHAGALAGDGRGRARGRAARAARLVRAFMYVNAADDLLRLGRWDEAARAARGGRADGPLAHGRRAAARRGRAAARAARRPRGGARRELDAPPTTASRPSSSRRWRRARGARARRGRPRRGRACTSRARSAASRTRSTRRRCTRSALRAEAELAEQRARRRDAGPRARAGAARRASTRAGRAAPDALAHRALARAELARVDGAPRRALARAAAAFDALAEPYPAAYARLHEAEATLIAGGERPPRRARSPPRATPRGRARGAAAARGGRGARPARAARRSTRGRAAAAAEDDGDGLTAREAEVLRCSPTASPTARSPRACSSAEDRRRPHGAHLRQARRALARRGGRAAPASSASHHLGWTCSPLGAPRGHLWRVGDAPAGDDRPAGHRCPPGTPDDRKAPCPPVHRPPLRRHPGRARAVAAATARRPAPRPTRTSRRTPR